MKGGKETTLSLLQKNRLLFCLLVLVVFLRLPSLFEPYWYGDEGIYFAVAEGLKRGRILYREITDNKTPLIYYLFALLKTQFFVRLFLMFWVLTNTVFIFLLGELLFATGRLAALLFALLSSLTLLEGNIANGEIFFILPTTIGFWLLGQNPSNQLMIFLAGFSFSLAFLFKVPAVTDFIAGIFFLLTGKCFFHKILVLFLGFLLLPLSFSLHFLCHGALKEFLSAVFLNNIAYTVAWSRGVDPKVLLGGKFLSFFLLLLAFFLQRKKLKKESLLLYPYLFSSFLGATLSHRPYPHYLIQVLPPFSLLFAKLGKEKKCTDLLCFFTAILFALHFFNLGLSNLEYQLSYFQNFKDFLLQKKSTEEYLRFFDPITPRNYRLARFLERQTQPDEPIFIWADQALIFAISHRVPCGRFTSAHHIQDLPDAKRETIEVLERIRPKYIFVDRQIRFPFPQLFTLLQKEYNKVAQDEGIEIYKKI